jgi:hypothetical protein
MPVAMTGVWLSVGAVLIAALLMLGLLIPRPNPEYPLSQLVGLAGSKERESSRYAVMRDSPGKDEDGAAGTAQQGQQQGSRQGQGQSQGDQGRGGQQATRGGSGQDQGRGQSQQSGSQGRQGQGDSRGTSSQGNQAGNQGRSGQPSSQNNPGQGDRTGNQGRSGQETSKDNSNRGNQRDPQGQSRQERGQNDPDRERTAEDQERSGGSRFSQREPQQTAARGRTAEQQERDAANQSSGSGGSPPRPRTFVPHMPEFMSWLAPVLKWIVYGVLALIAAYALLRIIANFSSWAKGLLQSLQSLWQSLFGWWKPRQQAAVHTAEEEVEFRPRPRPFASFVNPFLAGTAERYTPAQLVRYSFEALEAWACDHGLGRQAEETPLEFAERLGGQLPRLEKPAGQLTQLYARVAYARGGLPASSVDIVRQFWQRLTPAAAEAVGAERGS